MGVTLLVCGLLCLMTSQAHSLCTPKNFTFYVEKQECPYCIAINTTMCSGFCYTQPDIRESWSNPQMVVRRFSTRSPPRSSEMHPVIHCNLSDSFQDTNLRGTFGKRLRVQQGCTYRSLAYHIATLPGCLPHVDPLFTYPKAIHCHCSKCNTARNECVHKASRSFYNCSNPLHTSIPTTRGATSSPSKAS